MKSRAALNFIAYNRITDQADGSASYELEFPNGSIAYVIGNIIQQSAHTQNEQIVSFGAEGYRWKSNELYLINNTLIDDLPRGGVFVRAYAGAQVVRIANNLLVGNAGWNLGASARLQSNPRIAHADLENAVGSDFRLRPGSAAWERRVPAGSANGVALDPQREYRHPRQTIELHGPATQPGAMQSPQQVR